MPCGIRAAWFLYKRGGACFGLLGFSAWGASANTPRPHLSTSREPSWHRNLRRRRTRARTIVRAAKNWLDCGAGTSPTGCPSTSTPPPLLFGNGGQAAVDVSEVRRPSEINKQLLWAVWGRMELYILQLRAAMASGLGRGCVEAPGLPEKEAKCGMGCWATWWQRTWGRHFSATPTRQRRQGQARKRWQGPRPTYTIGGGSADGPYLASAAEATDGNTTSIAGPLPRAHLQRAVAPKGPFSRSSWP